MGMKSRRAIFRVGATMVVVLVACAAVLAIVRVDRWALYRHGMATNTRIDFYGQVVDAQGKPVEGALVRAGVEGYNPLYLFGGSRERSRKVDAVTNADGRFGFRGYSGHTLWIEGIGKGGYQWLYGTQSETDDNISFAYHPQGYLYVPDPMRPALFPLVRPGETASVLPSRGGWQHRYDGVRTPNGPRVPHRPSVQDAVPATKK